MDIENPFLNILYDLFALLNFMAMLSFLNYFYISMIDLFLSRFNYFNCTFYLPLMATALLQSILTNGEVINSGNYISDDFENIINDIIIPVRDLLIYIALLYLMHELLSNNHRQHNEAIN
jgi:hypothetical protein